MSQIHVPGKSLTPYDAESTAPAGNVGVDLSEELKDSLRPVLFMVTLVVVGGASDVYLWGRRAVGLGDDTDDAEWGLINDRRGRVVLGKIATGLAAGTHHYFVEDLGAFGRIACQKSANDVTMILQPQHYGL
jgi:hypothetical protein